MKLDEWDLPIFLTGTFSGALLIHLSGGTVSWPGLICGSLIGLFGTKFVTSILEETKNG